MAQKWAQNRPKNTFFHLSVHFLFILKKNIYFFQFKKFGPKKGPKMGPKQAKKHMFSFICPFFHFELFFKFKKFGPKKGQKMGQNGPKNGENLKNGCHHFSGSKLHNIMVLAVCTRCFNNMGQKWVKNGPKKGPKTAKKWPNFRIVFFIDFLARNYLKKWY